MDNLRNNSSTNTSQTNTTNTNNSRGYYNQTQNNNFNQNRNNKYNHNNRNTNNKNKYNNNSTQSGSLPHTQFNHQSPSKFNNHNSNQGAFDANNSHSLDFNSQGVQTSNLQYNNSSNNRNFKYNSNPTTLGNNIIISNVNSNKKKNVNNKKRGAAGQNQNTNYQKNNINKNTNNSADKRLNRSLNKERTSANNSFDSSSNFTGTDSSSIPTSISLETFESINYQSVMRSPTMPNSFQTIQGMTTTSYSLPVNQYETPSHQLHQLHPTISEQHDTDSALTSLNHEQLANDVSASFYSTPLAHINHQNSAGNTSDEPATTTTASSSSSSSPDSKTSSNNNQDVTTDSQMLVTASEGEYSFKTTETTNLIENTITKADTSDMNLSTDQNNSIDQTSTENLVLNNESLKIEKQLATTLNNSTNKDEDEMADRSASNKSLNGSAIQQRFDGDINASETSESQKESISNAITSLDQVINENSNQQQHQSIQLEQFVANVVEEEAKLKYSNIEEEGITNLVNKIVLDVISQAVKTPPLNEKLSIFQEARAMINEEANNVSFQNELKINDNENELEQAHKIKLDDVELAEEHQAETTVNEIGIDESKLTNITSTSTTATTTKKRIVGKPNDKKEPVVDCFSCTIV